MGTSTSNENVEPEQEPSRNGDLYTIKDGQVFWKGVKVKNLHAHLFKPLDCGYGKDDFRVYYHDKKLEQVNPEYFKVYHNGAATDGEHFYYKGSLITLDEFQNKHYGKILNQVAPSNLYYIKNNQVYWDNKKVSNSPHGEFFSNLGGGYSKDYWMAYYHEHHLKEVQEISSFKYTPASKTAGDGNVKYQNGKLIETDDFTKSDK
jgi:hypothetical protein